MSQSSLVINTLKEISARDLNKAAERLAESNRLLLDAKTQREMLEKYREDYVAKYSDLLTQGMTLESMQNYQSFLKKLDQAIAGQEQIIGGMDRQVKRYLSAWQECQKKKLSYDVLSDRAGKKVIAKENKTEQKMMDEFASRARRWAHS